MATTAKNKSRRAAGWILLGAAAAVFCRMFPLFHVVPLKTLVAEKQAQTFPAAAIAQKFWAEKLLPAARKTVSADVLLAAIEENPASARTNYGHSPGLSDSYFYFLRGVGRVVSVSDDQIGLAIRPNSTRAEIVLETGLLFGNALRDGSGLLNAGDYPNSQDFNDLAAALNHLAETGVLPELRTAKIGQTVSFAGCAEVDDESTDLHPLQVIPIQATVQ